MYPETVTTETHHMVDDDRNELQAMDVFDNLFPYRRYLNDQDHLTYLIKHQDLVDSILDEAKKIIKANTLPLEAKIITRGYSGAVITVKPKA
jgi:hypothetical protein